MTSSCRIFTKTSGNVSLHVLVLWCKYEVICTIWRQVMDNFVFPGLLWTCIGNFRLSLTNIQYLWFGTSPLPENRREQTCTDLDFRLQVCFKASSWCTPLKKCSHVGSTSRALNATYLPLPARFLSLFYYVLKIRPISI